MTSSDRTCLQLRQYLTTMQKTDPPFGPRAGRKMMETLFLSNWQHEKNGERLSDPARMQQIQGGDEVRVPKGEMEAKREGARKDAGRGRGRPSFKRRRLRGGATTPGRDKGDKELSVSPGCERSVLMTRQESQGGDDERSKCICRRWRGR